MRGVPLQWVAWLSHRHIAVDELERVTHDIQNHVVIETHSKFYYITALRAAGEP
jgi:hypothetical protein